VPIAAEFAMIASARSSLFSSIAALAAVVSFAETSTASWITIKNDTKQMVVVQETRIVRGQVKRCKPVSLLPGETLREFLSGPDVKKIDVLDGHNPKRSVWSGSLHCKDESQTFSVTDSGGTVTVRPVVKPQHIPPSDRK
jgi:hypothetical protein